MRLLDPSTNYLGKHFKKYFQNLTEKDFLRLSLRDHLKGKGLKQCKISTWKLLKIYTEKQINFNIVEQFKGNLEELQRYKKWKEYNSFNSSKIEYYQNYKKTKTIFFGKKKKNVESIAKKEDIFSNNIDVVESLSKVMNKSNKLIQTKLYSEIPFDNTMN